MELKFSLILCFIGFAVYGICVGRDRVPQSVAEIGRLVGFAGLLAWLFGH